VILAKPVLKMDYAPVAGGCMCTKIRTLFRLAPIVDGNQKREMLLFHQSLNAGAGKKMIRPFGSWATMPRPKIFNRRNNEMVRAG
jgi:hypothetical protein